MRWGQTLAVNTRWQFVVGTLMFVAAASIMAGGWRTTLRLQSILFWTTVVGIVSCGLIAIFTSRSRFIHNFNSFAGSHTHSADTYHATIAAAQKAGVDTNPGFSFGTRYRFLESWRSPQSTPSSARPIQASCGRHGL